MRKKTDDNLKLGKGIGLRQEPTEAAAPGRRYLGGGLPALPKPITQSRTDYRGMVVVKNGGLLLAESKLEGRPSVNDMAGLLAQAMLKPLAGNSHRPRRLQVRRHPQWRELFPHLKELGIRVSAHEDLPKANAAYQDYLHRMREDHRVGMVRPTAEQASVEKLFPAIAQWVRGYGHIEIGDQEMFGFVARALTTATSPSRMTSRARWPRRWRRWRRDCGGISRTRASNWSRSSKVEAPNQGEAMPRMKLGPPGDKVGLQLTAAERNLLLEGLTCLPTEYERLIQDAPPSEPIVLKLDQLDDLAGYVAAAANHATDKKTQKKLDTVFRKIQRLLGSNADEAPLKAVRAGDGKADKLVAQTSVMIGEWAAQALATAKQLGIERKVVGAFPSVRYSEGRYPC